MGDKEVNELQYKIYREIEEKEKQITRRIGVVEHAKIVRAELKEKFPKVKFKVRTARFAGGDSVTVYHVGEIDKEVQYQIRDFVKQFDGFESDLMDGRYNVGFMYKGERLCGATFCSYNWEWWEK